MNKLKKMLVLHLYVTSPLVAIGISFLVAMMESGNVADLGDWLTFILVFLLVYPSLIMLSLIVYFGAKCIKKP